MRVAVCVKPAPQPGEMAFDATRGRLVRGRLALRLGKADVAALAWGVHLTTDVLALAMAPPAGRDALLEALRNGVGRAVLLCDPRFAGSDAMATAQVLAQYLRQDPPDLVLCGNRSADGRTGQVGPMLAALLGWPLIADAVAVRRREGTSALTVTRQAAGHRERASIDLPAVVTVREAAAAARRAAAPPQSAATVVVLDAASAHVQAPESRTCVLGTERRPLDRQGLVLVAPSSGQAQAAIADALRQTLGADGKSCSRPSERYGLPVWVVGSAREGESATAGLIGQGRRLVGPGGQVTVWVRGHPELSCVDAWSAAGAHRVVSVEGPHRALPDARVFVDALAAVARRDRPGLILVSASNTGRAVGARLAGALGAGMIGDAWDVRWNGGRLLGYKPVVGQRTAVIGATTQPTIISAAPGMFAPPAGRLNGAAVHDTVVVSGRPPRWRALPEAATGWAPSADAKVVLGVGLGVGRAGVATVAAIARASGFGIAATLDVVEEGWLPEALQVGLSGRAISPTVYVALGISGAAEHLAGLRGAHVIVAVNRDPTAPIFRQADVGLVADWRDVLTWLASILRDVAPQASA